MALRQNMNRSISMQLRHPPVVEASVKKKVGGARLWMKIDRWGQSEMLECDKAVIMQRTLIPARDFRVLGPICSHSSTILVREKAIIINLEFIKAIVTSEEVFIPDPICLEVLPFVDHLRRQFPQSDPCEITDQFQSPTSVRHSLLNSGSCEDAELLPFEFQVLEIALEKVCSYLNTAVSDLERDAYPALDELTLNVSINNLEHVRSLKSDLTRLLARAQKVRDEVEHLLDDDEDMSELYLTRKKWIENEQEAEALSSNKEGIIAPMLADQVQHHSGRGRGRGRGRDRGCHGTTSESLRSNHTNGDIDVEDLEMLLEPYFHQLDAIHNKILSVREYIDDTEDYVNIRLDGQRNELIQLQLMISIASFTIAAETLATGILSMNFPFPSQHVYGTFAQVVGWMTAATVALFLLLLGYAGWKNLIGS